MKWTRKTEFGQFKPYISENGKFKVVDMSFYKAKWFRENGKSGFWWALLDENDNIIKAHFKTAKAAKEYAEKL